VTADAETDGVESGRGRHARAPLDIPRRGWKDVAIRVKREIRRDRVSSVAAGVAFFGMLSLFPALIAVVSCYGLIADPADVERQIRALAAVLPGPAQEVIGSRLRELSETSRDTLSIGLVISVVVALGTASSGTTAMIEAVNVAYDEPERRGFFRLRALALAMALAVIVFGIVALFVITALPIAFEWAGLGGLGRTIATLLRWPLLALVAVIGLGALYRYAPNRDRARWRWVSPGAVIATLLWIVASLLFSLYVSGFGNYGATYGTLAGVILLMLWMYMSTLAILVGAEVNAEIEAQTAEDSTVGPPQPMGSREAKKADELGETFG
jgi:membrane protein